VDALIPRDATTVIAPVLAILVELLTILPHSGFALVQTVIAPFHIAVLGVRALAAAGLAVLVDPNGTRATKLNSDRLGHSGGDQETWRKDADCQEAGGEVTFHEECPFWT
jgi:hypothetical protein